MLTFLPVGNHLNFSKHLDLVASKTVRAITSLQDLVQDTGGVNRDIGVMLHKAYVLPNIEYAYPTWCTINSSSVDRLEKLQHISLLKATGCLNSTASNVLNLLTLRPVLFPVPGFRPLYFKRIETTQRVLISQHNEFSTKRPNTTLQSYRRQASKTD